MIVYADREEHVNTRFFRKLVDSATDPVDKLILAGQFESAVTDALCPNFDDEIDFRGRLPERITIRKPEGYAFYSLYPEAYRDAALRFVAEQGTQAAYVVIGIRSIGASLSKVVADTVGAKMRFTVRPRGHPFHRELKLSPRLEQRVREHDGHWFLVVDEGPGLSGSSFMSVARKLEELGITGDRIVLFPAHTPDPACFKSEYARENWTRYRGYAAEFDRDRFVPAAARDISGGLWRDIVYAGPERYPAVQPQHERRKYLHDGLLWKFSGLGHFGRSRYERAQRLTTFCPRPCGLENGFLVAEWIDGCPAVLNETLLDAMARYLAFLCAEFATDKPVPMIALEQMIEVNSGLRLKAPDAGPAVAVDGRMLPQEWLETKTGYSKVDALDHHDDHFFPGCQDIAWDIAGAAVEWDFDPEALITRYLRLQHDPELRKRIPFYMTAYRAYRFGYCTMAAEGLSGTDDGARFQRSAARYATAMPRAMSELPSR